MRIKIGFNKERQMRLRAFINRQSKRATSVAVHICMILGVTLYTIFGALIMQRIESQQIQKHKLLHQQQPKLSIDKRMAVEEQWHQKFEVRKHQIRLRHVKRIDQQSDCLGPIIKALRHSHCNESALRQLDYCYRFLSEREMQREGARQLDEKLSIRYGWSFTDSVLFCFTVITTIGYGNVAPKTFQGRLFCILYALIGIPFTLLAIADLGKFLSEILEGWERTCRSAKKEVQQCWRDFRTQPKKFSIISLLNAQSSFIIDPNNNNAAGFMDRLQVFRGNKSSVTTPGTDNNNTNPPFDEAMLNRVEQGEAPPPPAPAAAEVDEKSKSQQQPAHNEEEDENGNDEESQQPYERSQTIPLLIMFILYVFTGAFLLSAYEPDMNFFKAIYFNFVSLTSIGLGDVVPQSEAYMAFTLLYIAVGLALTTIAVEIAADYLKKLHYFGRKIENVGNVAIWFGSKRLTVKQLVKNLGDQFNLPVHQIKTLDLDNFVDNAIKVEQGELETLRPPPFEPPKEEELTYADDEAIIEWEPQKTPSTPSEPEEPIPEPEPEPEPVPEPEPEPVPEPEPEPEPPAPEEQEAEIVEELKVEPSTDSERRKSNYSEEAWRRYLEYQKQWKKFRHTQTKGIGTGGGASSVSTDIAHISSPRSAIVTSIGRPKSALDTVRASTSAEATGTVTTGGSQKLSLPNRDSPHPQQQQQQQQPSTTAPPRQKKTSSTTAAVGQHKLSTSGGGTTTTTK